MEDKQEPNKKVNPNERENLGKIFDFQFDSLKETTKVLERGVSFYFIITGIVLGLIFSNKVDLDQTVKLGIINFLIASSIFTTLCVFIICWSIISGVISLKATLKSYSGDTYEKSSINNFFNRGIISSIIIGVLCSLFMIYFINYFYSLKNQVELQNMKNSQVQKVENSNESTDTINVRLIDPKNLIYIQDSGH